MANTGQIFQTSNSNRWQRFKWIFRVLLLALPIIGIIIYTGFNVFQPDVPLEGRAIKKVLTQKKSSFKESPLEKSYKGFRKAIDDKKNHKDLSNKNVTVTDENDIGIRAAFYVAWDAQSYTSLEKNLSKINLVIPEWFLINPIADTLYTNIDKKALALMQKSGVKIMPILTNNYRTKFRGDAVRRILKNEQKKERLINDILKLLNEYHFAGVNIDFEDLELENDAPLVAFQKELYEKLHAQNFLVSQDVIPFNDDYNYKALAKYNDYLILMAYDQNHNESKPGPICTQKWIEAAVDKAIDQLPSEKIILGMAGYGYDWTMKSKKPAIPITYQEALAHARESEATIKYDNDTYNLYFQYYDSDDSLHEVHFTDAATNFNTLRFATEANLAGTALWRLGSEDSRLWDFYHLPMTKEALQSFNFEEFNRVEAGFAPDYIGEGEVLDIIASPKPGHIRSEIDPDAMLISEEYYDELPSTYVIRKFGKVNKRKIVLSYDDGPDPLYTKQILDTLAYYHVPASFFIVGLEAEKNIPLIKRIFREGHELGNHTFTHPNMAEVSKRRAILEMDGTRLLIECITGHSTIMFRAPFNADSEPGKNEELVPIALSRAKNYITVGESIDPEDWEKGERPDFNDDTIFNRVVRAYEKRIYNEDKDDTTGINGAIILLHDAGGDRSETVKATGKIIRYFQAKGYQFTTVADLLGKKPDDVMPPIPRNSNYYWLQINYVLAEIGYIGGHFFFAMFMTFLGLSVLRLLIIGAMAILQKQKEKKLLPKLTNNTLKSYPLVSIIVPAYNEEVNAVSSLQNLLKCTYPNFNIIFVDDGSKDNTYTKVATAFETDARVQIFTKPNGGKASALNFGIAQTQAEYVVCIDADTKLKADAVEMIMRQFFEDSVNELPIGAIAGVVKVGNTVNTLTNWQNIEYITSQNFDRKGFAYANAITVVPGAIGAFSKKAIKDAGGFTTDTLAEDCDLTIRILKAGYRVANEPKAIAYTEAPETLRQFLRQRNRWSFGVMQVFWKNRDTLFNPKYGSLGLIAMPDLMLFRYIIPFFAPLADLLMLIGLLTDNTGIILEYYLIFTIVDVFIAALSFLFEKENLTKLLWLLPQRIIYRWLMLFVLFSSLRRAIKGELQHWGVLKRTGNVTDATVNS